MRAAWDEAAEAYADELLPAILPGTGWTQSSENRLWALLNYDGDVAGELLAGLVDHPLLFRREGVKGRPTWANTVLIGRPYDAVTADGRLLEDARTGAGLLETRGRHRQLGCWPACEMRLSRVGGRDDDIYLSELCRLPLPG